MNRYVTQGIVLGRTDFGEADRIITFLTPDHGKLTVMAKGVRKTKSKLAGGIELFSISDLTLLVGRGEIQTLMSSRLAKHYGHIVKELARSQAGYEIIKLINKATEEAPEKAYFDLLKQAFEALDDAKLDPAVTKFWSDLQLLRLTGHMPDLRSDLSGSKLAVSKSYDFQLEAMRFASKAGRQGNFTASDVKFLRLGFAAASPRVLQRVKSGQELVARLDPLLQSMLKSFFRI